MNVRYRVGTGLLTILGFAGGARRAFEHEVSWLEEWS